MYKKHDSFFTLKHKKDKKISDIIDRIIKVSKDTSIIEKLPLEKGKKVNITEVLLISENGKPVVGNPLVEGASVDAEVIDQIRAKKIIVFKKKRRKGYKVKNGHRQMLTKIKIDSISIGKKAKSNNASEKEVKKTTVKKTTVKKTTVKKTTVKKTTKS